MQCKQDTLPRVWCTGHCKNSRHQGVLCERYSPPEEGLATDKCNIYKYILLSRLEREKIHIRLPGEHSTVRRDAVTEFKCRLPKKRHTYSHRIKIQNPDVQEFMSVGF